MKARVSLPISTVTAKERCGTSMDNFTAMMVLLFSTDRDEGGGIKMELKSHEVSQRGKCATPRKKNQWKKLVILTRILRDVIAMTLSSEPDFVVVTLSPERIDTELVSKKENEKKHSMSGRKTTSVATPSVATTNDTTPNIIPLEVLKENGILEPWISEVIIYFYLRYQG